MDQRIEPVRKLEGGVLLPGDKSISHRYAMLAAIAEGTSKIHNYATGADCHSTLACLRALGVSCTVDGTEVTVEGVGLHGLREPSAPLDAGNSGSTIRMLSGILAAQRFRTVIAGDESLSRRPMERIMRPLREMGATIEAQDGKYPPLEITGGVLKPIDYTLPVPSAQVKSCVLLAGLYAPGTTVRESVRTRDHTELALADFGAEIETRRGEIRITGPSRLSGRELLVPCDLSSAAFFLVAASVVPNSDIVVQAVGLNPTRTALIDFLVSMGARIRVLDIQHAGRELIGNLRVTTGQLTGGVIEGALTTALIDEIPVLAVAGALSRDGIVVRNAEELRIKETDRIATVAENFRRMGVSIEVMPDGFRIPGDQQLQGAEIDSFGDHRIAMAFSVAALAAGGPSVIRDATAASVSFPEFFDRLRSLSA